MEKTLKRKAVIYCVRAGRLLVFTQPDSLLESGVQVPAGTVRDGESPLNAARRELTEETGHDGFEIVRLLGRAFYDQWPYRAEIHERYFFEAAPTQDLPETWTGEEAHDGQAPPTRFEFFWIPLERAHVLVAGQSAFIGMVAADSALMMP